MITRGEKDRARSLVSAAKKRGTLVPQPCEVCGTTEKIEAHHDDYTQPLAVRWLCFRHHRLVHRQQVGAKILIHTIGIRLSEEMYARLERLAELHQQTPAGIARLLIQAGIGEFEKKAA